MENKFGKNSAAFEAFLEEVRGKDVEGWRVFSECARPSQAGRDASSALVETSFPASVRAAAEKAVRDVIRGLDFTDEDLPEGKEKGNLTVRIKLAAKGLAAGDALAPEHRHAILAPFAEAGFQSVTGPMAEALRAQESANRN